MTDSLLTLLTAGLQIRGIYDHDYQTLVNAVSDTLMDINRQMRINDYVELPNGSTWLKTWEPKNR